MIDKQKLVGSCGDRTFGFSWSENYRTDDNHFVLGDLQIIINNQELLDIRTYDLNIIFRYFKDDLKFIKETELDFSNKDKDKLFFNTLRFWGYWTFAEVEAEKLGKINSEDVNKAIEDYWENNQDAEHIGGYKFNLYSDISDQGWHFYLFRTENKERLLYSNNHGKDVYEVLLPLGTVEKVLSELPNC